MTQFVTLSLLVVVLVTLVNASNVLDSGLIFEDIRIENIDAVVSKKITKSRPHLMVVDEPTFAPTAAPTTPEEFSFPPTFTPTFSPTEIPTESPTEIPTFSPTEVPTEAPTEAPTTEPTYAPTHAPTLVPTPVPTLIPTVTPTETPSVVPSVAPTVAPTVVPTFAPSRSPTLAPSAAPSFTRAPTVATAKKPGVAINGKLGAKGMTAAQFNSNKKNGQAMASAIDKASNVPSGSTACGLAVDVNTTSVRRRLQTSSSIFVPYTITIESLSTTTYTSSDEAYTAINSLLVASVDDNTFTTYVAEAATSLGITLDLNVSSVEPTGFATIAVDDNHHRYVSDGQIAGIVIGSIVGVALLGVFFYYMLRMRRASSGEADSSVGDKGEVYRDFGSDTLPAITNGNEHNDSSLVVASDNGTRV